MVAMRIGDKLFEGKTKVGLRLLNDVSLVLIRSKDDITAGDGEKHDILGGKGDLSTETTSNVFNFLRSKGVPVAFHGKYGRNCFVAPRCNMLPFEVVVRGEAHGSYLKREPDLTKGHKFNQPLVEFYLKTSGKIYEGHPIPVDDPLIVMANEQSLLYLPNKPLVEQEPFLIISGYPPHHEEMKEVALKTFLLLRQAWASQGITLVDFKVEFGKDFKDNLLLADVIDNDSWRLVEEGKYLDKQVYREGGESELILDNYRRVAEMTGRFLRSC